MVTVRCGRCGAVRCGAVRLAARLKTYQHCSALLCSVLLYHEKVEEHKELKCSINFRLNGKLVRAQHKFESSWDRCRQMSATLI